MRTPGSVAVSVAISVTVVLALAGAALPVAAHGNHLSADSQVSADGTLIVESVLPIGEAWIVVRADDDGSPGEVLGYAPVDDEDGLRTDVPVDIDDEHWADWSDTRTVWIVLHDENGDGEFDPADDELSESFGEPAGDRLRVRKGDAPAYVTAEEFSPQPSDDGTVVVRSAALPEDGYVVVHDAGDEGPGDVVGSTALASGIHDNVTVELDGEYFGNRDGTFTLWAVVYTDDGSSQFDDADGPVRVGEDSLATAFGVERTAQQSPTPGTVTATGDGEGDQDDDGDGHDDGHDGGDGHGDHEHDDGTATDGDDGEVIGDGPGFGLAGAAVAILATALAARSRRD